jgi:hypothetical protein
MKSSVAIEQRRLRQHGGAADRGDQHGIGLRRHQLQHLPGRALIVARVAFVGDDADAGLLGHRHEYLVPVLAIRVVEADEADRLHAVLRHVRQQRAGDEVVVLRRLEHPALLGIERLDDARRAHGGHHRNFGLRDEIEDRQRIRRGRRADQRVDVVLLDELLDVLHGARGVSAVLELHVLDGRVTDLPGQQVPGVFLRNADRRRRSGGGDHEADLHLPGGGEGTKESDGGEERTNGHFNSRKNDGPNVECYAEPCVRDKSRQPRGGARSVYANCPAACPDAHAHWKL